MELNSIITWELVIVEIRPTHTYLGPQTAKLAYFANLLNTPKTRRYLIYNNPTRHRSDIKLINTFDLQTKIFA